MKFAASLSLLGLASATPVAQQEAKSASQSATVLADAPVWAWSAAYISDDYYMDKWHYSLSLEEVPSAGENAHAICNGISQWSEGWCPKSEQQAMEVYSELVVRNFMPNSHAAGVLDESEVSNIPDSLQTGYRTNTWKDGVTIPDPIDNVDAVANRGSNGVNDVYGCGPVNNAKAYLQSVVDPTIGFLDDSAAAPNHCTALGMHNGYGDDFDNFKLKNVPCDETKYIICSDGYLPGMGAGSSHGGYNIVGAEMNSTNVDIMKAAFDIKYNPANQVVEEEESTEEGGETTEETTEAAGGNKNMMYGGVAVVVIAVVLFVVLGKK